MRTSIDNQKINEAIANGDTEGALKMAHEQFPGLQKEIAVLQSKYARIKRRYSVGAMDDSAYDVQIADISLKLVDALPDANAEIDVAKKKSRLQRLISFQMNFLKGVINQFSRSKYVLIGTLVFIVLVGLTSICFIGRIMPTTFGMVLLGIVQLAFFTLIISSPGFLDAQIKQFRGTKSFLKFEDQSQEDV